jgi:hypothetical protein
VSKRFVVLSDIHDSLVYLPMVASETIRAGGIVIAGDITTFSLMSIYSGMSMTKTAYL